MTFWKGGFILPGTGKPPVFPERVIGLISPHAGYDYSGKTAAYGYKLLKGKKIKRVSIFALSHRVSFHGASIVLYE
jgi:hypothetical protein